MPTRIYPGTLVQGFIFSLLLLAAGLVSQPALAKALTFPALTGRVVDNAELLDVATTAHLTELLIAHEAKTTDQIVVVTVPSLKGTMIEDYGYQLGRHWGVGQKQKNNGVLLIVAPHERKVRIEVGYGLEAILTDAAASTIIQQLILPSFKAGDLQAGIVAGVEAILTTLGDPPVPNPVLLESPQDTMEANMQPPAVPGLTPDTLVMDTSNFLSSVNNLKLERELKVFGDQTRSKVFVVTVPWLGNEDILDFGKRIAQAWALDPKTSWAIVLVAGFNPAIATITSQVLQDRASHPLAPTIQQLGAGLDKTPIDMEQATLNQSYVTMSAINTFVFLKTHMDFGPNVPLVDPEPIFNIYDLIPLFFVGCFFLVFTIQVKRTGGWKKFVARGGSLGSIGSSSSSSSSSFDGGGGSFGGGGSSGSW